MALRSNDRMPSTPTDVDLLAPTLLVTADLGHRPPLGLVIDYLDAIGDCVDLAYRLAEQPNAAQATQIAEQAVAMAVRHGDPVVRAQALAVLAEALTRSQDVVRAVGIARQAAAAAESIDDPVVQAHALTALSAALMRQGDMQERVIIYEEAANVAERAIAVADTVADPAGKAQTLTLLATALIRAGDTQRAETAARKIVDPAARATALTILVNALRERGHHRQAKVIARTIIESGHGALGQAVPGSRAHPDRWAVERLSMASPLEVALTVAGNAAPIGYAITAVAIVERLVRLLIEWQKHRATLRTAFADPADPAGEDTALPLAAATNMLAQVTGAAGVEPDTATHAQLQQALVKLGKWHLVRVERS
jgi:tetratricopeptide (TPR) repeat protein